MADVITSSSNESGSLTAEQAVVARWLERRRVYLFVMFFFLVSAGAGIQQDPAVAKPLDLAYVAALTVGFGVIVISWRRRTQASAAFQQRLLLAMTVLLVLITFPLLILVPLHTAGAALLFSAMLLLNRLL